MNTGPLASVVVRLEVTQDDIDQGIEGDCSLCPVARALARATGCGVSIDSSAILFWSPGKRVFDMNTPPELQVFMARFDNFGASMVEPFTTDLTLPAWIVGEAEAA